MRKEDLELEIKALNEDILKEKDPSVLVKKKAQLQRMVETFLSMKNRVKETKQEAVNE